MKGDGIGPEVVGAAMQSWRHPGGAPESASTCARCQLERPSTGGNGAAISAAGLAAIRTADATLKSPVGLPDVRHAEGTEARVFGGTLRGGLSLYANVRPTQLLPGAPSRLTQRPGRPVTSCAENTEGLYAARPGRSQPLGRRRHHDHHASRH